MLNSPLTQNWVNVNGNLAGSSQSSLKKNDKLQEISIFDLPCEILLKVFSYLDLYSLTNRIALVCKLWSNIARDSSLCKSISLDGKYIHHIPLLVIQYPYLRHLKIEGVNLNENSFKAFADCLCLQSLSLRFCKIPRDCSISFESVLKNCINLNFIDLEGCEVCCHVLEKLYMRKSLMNLNLSHCIQLENNSLIQILENCHNLQELDIDGINLLRDYAISSIFKICSNNLVSLLIDGEDLSDSAFIKLQNCSKLKKFGISFCESLTDYFLLQVKSLKNLEFLKLRKGTGFTPHGIEKMFKEGSLNQITHLNLSECSSLNNSSVTAIADCCKDLLSLNLGWCWEVTDDSIVYLVNKCLKIRVLDLTGLVCLHGQFIFDLKEGQLKDIKIIDLEQCGFIKDDQLVELVQLRPNIQIFNFWGDIINSN